MQNIALIVDDSPTVRSLVKKTLSVMGFDVIDASNGQEALNEANGLKRIDIVVADVNMPIMDGITFVQKLRGIERYQFTPVLMLTTETKTAQKEKAKAAGATGWLTKPFEPHKLTVTVRRVLA